MSISGSQSFFTLFQREVLEYRGSLLITPLAMSGLLILLMLGSVLLANRISFVGDQAIDVLIDEQAGDGVHITIDMEEQIPPEELVIGQQSPQADDSEWDFGRDWSFEPDQRDKLAQQLDEEIGSLNNILNALHLFFMLVLFGVCCNYLLGTFYQDRRDRSVLFWKSMPVSERDEILAKIGTIALVAPVIYIGASFITQLAWALLAILLVWRMDMDPNLVILDNINFVSLYGGQLLAWPIAVIWFAPVFAWLLFCSSAARRSPLLMAIAIPLALIIIDELFLGGGWISEAISARFPGSEDEQAGAQSMDTLAPALSDLDLPGMLSGIVLAGLLLWATHWFRKHKFES